jgi:TM2 domain-containing membrane protein YozV
MTAASQIGALTLASYVGILFGPLIFGTLSMLLGQLRWALLVAACVALMITPLSMITSSV